MHLFTLYREMISMNKISKNGMLGLFLAAIFLVVSIFFPWWGMKLTAPQYKEGLYIYVYPYKMDGQIDIINSLNHYIGMAEFSEDSFPELKFLPYLIVALAIITILIGLLRRRRILLGWLGIIAIGGAMGIYDIYRWLHTFGTELDPKAPIEIDPFVPPIIGTNQLANFQTLSFFSYGAGFAMLSILIMVAVYWKGKES
mgnify:CR=1 FL=1